MTYTSEKAVCSRMSKKIGHSEWRMGNISKQIATIKQSVFYNWNYKTEY